MRTSKEMAGEVWRRVEIAERGEDAKRRKMLSITAAAACLAVVIGLSFAMPYFPAGGTAAGTGRYSATLFAQGTAGGYVLVGVLAFMLGAGTALLCVKLWRKK